MHYFTTRIQLHETATKAHYDVLHAQMERGGFARTVKGSDNIIYHLQHAEYLLTTTDMTMTAQAVRLKASTIADAVFKPNSVFLGRADSLAWLGLDIVKTK